MRRRPLTSRLQLVASGYVVAATAAVVSGTKDLRVLGEGFVHPGALVGVTKLNSKPLECRVRYLLLFFVGTSWHSI